MKWVLIEKTIYSPYHHTVALNKYNSLKEGREFKKRYVIRRYHLIPLALWKVWRK